MASNSGSSKSFGSSVQKTVRRAKEKVLQNIGKADKTADEVFDNLVANFNKQQAAALRLQKEVKAYANELKAVSTVSASLYGAISDLYEDDWHHSFDIKSRTEAVPLSWQTYANHLHEDIVQPINDYCAKFADMKARIAKRNRKLIDYDSARHTLADLQTSKTPNQTKISKAEMDLREKQHVFEEINDDLLHTLPQLYQERVTVLSVNFFNIFKADAHLGEELSKINNQLVRMVDQSAAGDMRSAGAGPSSHTRHNGEKNDSLPRYSDAPMAKREEASRSDDEDNDNVGKVKRQSTQSIPDDSYESIEVAYGFKKEAGKPAAGGSLSPAVPMSSSSNAESGEVIYSQVKRVKSTLVESGEPKHNGLEDNGASASENRAHTSKESPVAKVDDSDSLTGANGGHGEEVKDMSRVSSTASHKEPASPGVQPQPHQLQQPPQQPQPHQAPQSPQQFQSQQTQQPPQQHYQTPVTGRVISVHEAAGQSGGEKPVGGVVQQTNSVSVEHLTYQVPVTSLSPYLYMVQAVHVYEAEDVDELALDVGDVVGVIPFPDPEDQDDGWLMGVKISTGQRGVFPANFTTKLN